eukprot:TRINITY_DN61516_c0_g1_i1.p1 TRINITY_DN61516_c0_g1~~TRINITY_DN61516_c0_g1_i1.p1  ORF type:complete len:464 (-),score=94.41 TRINITY_DN61516_c0_g1_i1:174-1544(-)
MDDLQSNPVGCSSFEPNVFRREKCKNCGHPWHQHLGVISQAALAEFSSLRQQAVEARTAARAKFKAQAGTKKRRAHRAVEDGWFFDREQDSDGISGDECDSDGEGFRMFVGQDLELAPIDHKSASSSGSKPLKIVNLIDFLECNPPAALPTSTSTGAASGSSSSVASAASSSSSLATSSSTLASSQTQTNSVAAGYSMPMRSKDDVLLEEIQFLRQMLKDTNEEKRIQVAIVRDEVADKQRTIDELRQQVAVAEANLTKPSAPLTFSTAPAKRHEMHEMHQLRNISDGFRQEVENLLAENREKEACISTLQADFEALSTKVKVLESTCQDLHAAQENNEVALTENRHRLDWWEAPQHALSEITSESEIIAWEGAFREASQKTLGKLADRRIELRFAAAMDAALCKICYDRPVSCALLPCRHHAFCTPCASRVESSREPACPLCRTTVTGLFETFSG